MITQDRVKELFTYSGGNLYNRVTRNSKALAGSIAGWVEDNGYRRVYCDGKRYQVHHLVWLWHHGELPATQLDHKDHCRDNNSISNLRLANPAIQAKNRSIPNHNTSGVMGVSWISKKKHWQVTIAKKYRGSFKTIEEATAKAKEIYKAEGYHNNHGSSKEEE